MNGCSQYLCGACGILAAVVCSASIGDLARADDANAAQPPAVTWESLDARMRWEADRGFSGVVLVARDGAVMFHNAYGMANREKKIAMRPDTILAIGSTPIDFTMAGVLLLVEQNKLRLADPIATYLPNVPSDKQTMTIGHCMTERSGLPDFHHLPTDADRDHTWIDRDEAVRRILAQPLLFAPGKGRKHSHSAWGLLAAILEQVSGQSYEEFVRERLFKPAGMTDTGFFGEPCPQERMAVGYGPLSAGKINAPPYWGKTSWLVMGSGGQVSTAADMYAWIKTLRGGKLLSKSSLVYFGSGNDMATAGNAYGFEIVYAGKPRSCMVVMSNAITRERLPDFYRLGEELTALVTDRKAR
jgi:CubicO group peptidase (beta-lactamase class C family)